MLALISCALYVSIAIATASRQRPTVTVKFGADISQDSPDWQSSVLVNGVSAFTNHAIFVKNCGVTYVAPGGVQLMINGPVQELVQKSTNTSKGSDRFGDYESKNTYWVAGNATMITAVRTYTPSDIVIMAQEFPDGLTGSSVWDPLAVSSGFPVFVPDSTGAADEQLRWMAYNGWDCTNLYGCVGAQAQRVAMGLWNSESTFPYGTEGTGPMAIMAPNGTTAVISAAANFMTLSQAIVPIVPPPTPPSPLPPLSSFKKISDHYCHSGNKYAFTANNISLEQCLAQCVNYGCLSFEYDPGWPRPQPYCYNCRVLSPSDPCKLTVSGQNYTTYQRATAPPSPGSSKALAYGLMGSIEWVPPGYSTQLIISAGNGPNDAVRQWGARLSKAYNKSNPRDKDFTTTHLGYDTDNGGYYYYNPEPGKTYDQTLMDVHAYAEKLSIPYKHVQLDSWWYIKGVGNGVKTWAPGPNTFPDGLASFHNRSGWRITAHNRMWAADNTYAKQNGGDFEWLIEGIEAVPLQQEFWNWLMGQAKNEGIYVYEQDWLFTEFIGTNATLSSPVLATNWLNQMARGAENLGLVIQYCMLWPRMALQSLEYPSVTTARASTDYHAGSNDQWILGLSSLFLDSLELKPTKDNYFSTDSQGTGKKGVERFNRLQALVSTLTTGPVFPSDAIGDSDSSLIMRSCNKDGLLLRPSKAATNIDSNILSKALARGSSSTEPGEVQSAFSTIKYQTSLGNTTTAEFYYLLAAQTDPMSVSLSELTSNELSGKYAAFEFNSTSKIHSVAPDTALQLPATDRWSFQYWTFAPMLGKYWFLGEAGDKWVACSEDRFTSIMEMQDSLKVTGVGAPGEKVVIAWVPDGENSASVQACTVPGSGVFVAVITETHLACS